MWIFTSIFARGPGVGLLQGPEGSGVGAGVGPGAGVGTGPGPGSGVGVGLGAGVGVGVTPGMPKTGSGMDRVGPGGFWDGWLGSCSVIVLQPSRTTPETKAPSVLFFMTTPYG